MTPLFVGGKTEALDGPGNLLKVQLFKKKEKRSKAQMGKTLGTPLIPMCTSSTLEKIRNQDLHFNRLYL